MHWDWKLRQAIQNQLGYTGAHVRKAKEMTKQKRSACDVYCQLRAAQGGIEKAISKLFDEAVRKDLAANINRLLNTNQLTPKQTQTLTTIIKEMHTYNTKQVLRACRTVQKIEALLCWFLMFGQDFLELLLQNSPLV